MVVNGIIRLLGEHGHDVIGFTRSSAEIPYMRLGRVRAFFSGIYSLSSRQKIKVFLARENPDIVHIHNVFPLISPSVLSACRQAGIPTVMTVHNYRLVCPNGLHMADGQICEKCCGGHEYWCVLRNCENNLFKSIGYALRNYAARKLRLFRDNVNIFICLTEFQKAKLVAEGFTTDRCTVIPNMTDVSDGNPSDDLGDYIGFIGRISREKGIPTLLAAAKKLANIPFKAAGEYGRMPHLFDMAPANFEFLGYLSGDGIEEFYRKSQFVVLPSVCFEGFPMMILDAMWRQKPVICSRIGALPEIVEDGITGLLFTPGDADDLANKIRYLWERPDVCKKMGQAGREKVLSRYSPQKYYELLMDAYQKAIALNEKDVYQAHA
jgi:glycosyltransferase involved in cell wall biosynthesis